MTDYIHMHITLPPTAVHAVHSRLNSSGWFLLKNCLNSRIFGPFVTPWTDNGRAAINLLIFFFNNKLYLFNSLHDYKRNDWLKTLTTLSFTMQQMTFCFYTKQVQWVQDSVHHHDSWHLGFTHLSLKLVSRNKVVALFVRDHNLLGLRGV